MKVNALIILLSLMLLSFIIRLEQPKQVDIVFIGDSITYGAGLSSPQKNAPPAIAVSLLQNEKGIGRVNFSNQGVCGFTTVDFLPSSGTFAKADSVAQRFGNTGLLVFSVMLGTNDSAITGPNGAPVSKEQYLKNLMLITSGLLHDFPNSLIIVNRPLWYSPNTYNGAKYLEEGLTRLQSYFPEIDTLINKFAQSNPGHVYKGDTKAFLFFKRHHEQFLQHEHGHEGTFYLHPNEQGAAILGRYWENSIYKMLRNKLPL